MPEFYSGEQKTAIITMVNPTSKPFDYLAELYMGTDLAIMASAPFHLDAEQSKDISLPVTMPLVAGTYPVHIGVFSNGQSIGLYKAVEDVIIAITVPTFLAATILDLKWRLETEAIWHAPPISIQVDIPYLLKWTVRNDSDGDATFVMGTKINPPFPNIYTDTVTFIKRGEQAEIVLARTEWSTFSGQVTFEAGALAGLVTSISVADWQYAEVVGSITVSAEIY